MMARHRVTGQHLAKALGVSNAWVSYRINGKQAIDLNDLERIAAVLDVHVQDLLPNRDEIDERRRLLRASRNYYVRPGVVANVRPPRRRDFTRPGEPWAAAA